MNSPKFVCFCKPFVLIYRLCMIFIVTRNIFSVSFSDIVRLMKPITMLDINKKEEGKKKTKNAKRKNYDGLSEN